MLILKRSPRNKGTFTSRFVKGTSDFPLRQYLACREEVAGAVIQIVLLLAFAVSLAAFGFTLHRVFLVHGTDLPAWYELVALGGVAGMLVLAFRRIYRKIVEVRGIRAEMAAFKARISELEE